MRSLVALLVVGLMASPPRGMTPTLRSKKHRMTLTALVLIASALLLPGCFQTRVVPDPSIPHRLSRAVDVYEYHRLPDGSVAEILTTIPAGWWVASPAVVEGVK